MKFNSIYRQLLLNIVIPVIIVLLTIGVFSYKNTQIILREHNAAEQNFIYDEIKSFIELQFVALSIIEDPLAKKMQEYSNLLVNQYFANTSDIENADLNKIRKQLGIKSADIDLYIINRDGVVVNTTFKEDLFINFFNFSESHKQYLLNIFKHNKFDSPKFFFENKTKRYKKYSYHSTLDGKYIIEIGLYSSQADKIFDYMISHLDEIPKNKTNLISVDLFYIASGKPYPVNLQHEFINGHLKYIPNLIEGNVIALSNKDNSSINYTYLYLSDIDAKIFEGNIIRFTNNNSHQYEFIQAEKFKISILIFISLALVSLLIYFRSKKIVKPIKNLIDKTKIIANGNYSERVTVEGSNELAILSGNFNKMVNNIEERNNQIEEQSEFLYQTNRKLNEAYKLLDHQKSLIENKQDDLTDSINYALGIQKSLLPQPEALNEIFKESFVYNVPRDIVSGDFYWLSRVKNKIVITASDCTGHGVPGAFMSMIGMTILNHLVNFEHINDPALIISRLDAEICDLLIYNNNKEKRFEGMDTAICSIDFDTDELKFASAKRPLIIMRDGEIKTYKGSIYPIGEYYDSVQKVFNNTAIKLHEDDIIYMFSDGYTSQFNEVVNKKFNTSRFKKLLTEIHHKPIKEHPAILHRTIEAWKGKSEQIDDILIVAFKYTKNKIRKTISAKDIIDS